LSRLARDHGTLRFVLSKKGVRQQVNVGGGRTYELGAIFFLLESEDVVPSPLLNTCGFGHLVGVGDLEARSHTIQ
jgi:hypothetical protein